MCQNSACYLDLDLENEIEVQRSCNFNLSYLRHFKMHNQMFGVLRTPLSIYLRYVNDKKSEFNLLTSRFDKNAKITQNGIFRSVYEIFIRGLNSQLQFEMDMCLTLS